jgi:hypothetical protein
MIANVTLSFKFIGGSSLGGPIRQLQNAVSYNFYANTSLYRPLEKFQLNEKGDGLGTVTVDGELEVTKDRPIYYYGAIGSPEQEDDPLNSKFLDGSRRPQSEDFIVDEEIIKKEDDKVTKKEIEEEEEKEEEDKNDTLKLDLKDIQILSVDADTYTFDVTFVCSKLPTKVTLYYSGIDPWANFPCVISHPEAKKFGKSNGYAIGKYRFYPNGRAFYKDVTQQEVKFSYKCVDGDIIKINKDILTGEETSNEVLFTSSQNSGTQTQKSSIWVRPSSVADKTIKASEYINDGYKVKKEPIRNFTAEIEDENGQKVAKQFIIDITEKGCYIQLVTDDGNGSCKGCSNSDDLKAKGLCVNSQIIVEPPTQEPIIDNTRVDPSYSGVDPNAPRYQIDKSQENLNDQAGDWCEQTGLC